MTDTPSPSVTTPRRLGAIWLLLLLLLVLAGWRGWHWWQLRQAQAQTIAADTDQQQQADATNRVLRDELLGLGQRAALLEDSISKLADPERHGAQALRLDEVELLKRMNDDGRFGEAYYFEGEYLHDCKDLWFDSEGNRTWRLTA